MSRRLCPPSLSNIAYKDEIRILPTVPTLIRMYDLYLRDSGVQSCFRISAVATIKSPKPRPQIKYLHNIMVRDNRGLLDSMAGVIAIKPPYIGRLTPGSFTHRLPCHLLTLTTKRILYICRVLPELISLVADISSENKFKVTFTLPTYPS